MKANIDGYTQKQISKKIKIAIHNTNEEWMRLLSNKFKILCEKAIDEFYSDMTVRKLYKPTGNLHRAYYVVKEGNELSYHLSSERMIEKYKRNANADYIYKLTILNGYHGGAISGEGHPEVGVPYWREPVPNYPSWGEPAEQSEPPINEIITLKKERIDDISENLWWKIYEKELKKQFK